MQHLIRALTDTKALILIWVALLMWVTLLWVSGRTSQSILRTKLYFYVQNREVVHPRLLGNPFRVKKWTFPTKHKNYIWTIDKDRSIKLREDKRW